MRPKFVIRQELLSTLAVCTCSCILHTLVTYQRSIDELVEILLHAAVGGGGGGGAVVWPTLQLPLCRVGCATQTELYSCWTKHSATSMSLSRAAGVTAAAAAAVAT